MRQSRLRGFALRARGSRTKPERAPGAGGRLELALKLAAPYLAVGIFWLALDNAWLTILAYHLQILWWTRGSFRGLSRPRWSPLALLVVPSLLSGPFLYFVLPLVTRVSLSSWLADHRLSGTGLLVMVFYYGLVHPVLEQLHWAPLREATPFAHLAFAGYHLLVLSSLLALPWLVVCFITLAAASWSWLRLTRKSGSLFPAIVAHAAADLGMVIAALLQVERV